MDAVPPSAFLQGAPRGTQPEGWGELPCDLIRRIVEDYLSCGIDRLRLSWINRHWGETIRDMKLPDLPWMLLPSTSTPMFFVPVTRCLHKIWLPAALKSGMLCGSSGPWIFISLGYPERQFIVYNLCNGEKRGRIDLPVTILDKEGMTHEVWVEMAALSRPPSTAGYTVAAVVGIGESLVHTIATWESKDDHWTEIGTVEDGVFDMLFYQGSFHFLTSNEDLIRLVPEGLSFRMERYHVKFRSSKPIDDYYEAQEKGYILSRYLVESTAGHLLFAVKVTHDSKKTFDIKLLRLSVDDAGQARWAHYKNTADEMIYLGQASSVSCVSQGEPTIHFLDDRLVKSEDGVDHYYRWDMGGLQPHVLQVGWYAYRTPNEESRFCYRGPDDIGATDIPTPVWCKPQSGGSTTD
ncbi:hypothetical protein VPH35_109675 [Triticum aestivum]|uniref:KIB1-4 beta-propeller domain-containing protein n=3 Tax=Triticum TaxID=4564 RepID=A0A9R0YID0_TRITD|nr:uncharacterized protein LOC123136186 isoform X1 [Triticum aestivum]VAI55035.1 unnamed protein product [Triticum turgidum subsp. durum]